MQGNWRGAPKLVYKVNVDEDGAADGIALAKEMMADAYKLLAFYMDGCTKCTNAAFRVAMDLVVEDAAKSKDLKCMSLMIGEGKPQEMKARELRHLARMQGAKAALLEVARKRGGLPDVHWPVRL